MAGSFFILIEYLLADIQVKHYVLNFPAVKQCLVIFLNYVSIGISNTKNLVKSLFRVVLVFTARVRP